MNNQHAVLELKNVTKQFSQGSTTLTILDNVSLSLQKGSMVGLVGESGSGKTTLLQLCGLLDKPTSGDIIIDNVDCAQSSDKVRTKLRRHKIGFVYQFHHLLPEFSALENIIIPQRVARVAKKEAKAQAQELLNRVGLGHRLAHRPAELSGGEQQRVAIARALANAPQLLLADEPTGNLDPATAESVFHVLVEEVKRMELTMLVVTHNTELAARMDQVVTLKDATLT